MDNNRRFPLQPLRHHPAFICGDVKVDSSAAIAPGVLLQATANGSITIEAGVCVGMGVVITAYQGKVILKRGVVLGAGVLLMGTVEIGEATCIGRASTIMNVSISGDQVIAPFSVIGDYSRQIDSPTLENSRSTATAQPNSNAGQPQQREPRSQDPQTSSNNPEVEVTKSPVIGQVYVNELLLTLFPNRK